MSGRSAGEPRKATVRAGSNIAFIKYWGVDDSTLNLPQTNSISMTLADAYTTTTVEWYTDDVARENHRLRQAQLSKGLVVTKFDKNRIESLN